MVLSFSCQPIKLKNYQVSDVFVVASQMGSVVLVFGRALGRMVVALSAMQTRPKYRMRQ